jgi:hypothetical protein
VFSAPKLRLCELGNTRPERGLTCTGRSPSLTTFIFHRFLPSLSLILSGTSPPAVLTLRTTTAPGSSDGCSVFVASGNSLSCCSSVGIGRNEPYKALATV